MSNFRKTDFWWQWRQLQQRLSEWLELQLQQSDQPKPRNSNPEFLQWLAPYLTWGLGLILGGLLLFIIVRGFCSWQTQRSQRQLLNQLKEAVRESSVDRHEWLKRAQRYQRQGDFTQAARSLYFAMLQNLHDRQIIPDQRSRTDQEYAAMTRQLAEPTAFATLLQTHERIKFAGDQLSAPDYQRCQQAYSVTDQAIADTAVTSPARPRHRSSAKEVK